MRVGDHSRGISRLIQGHAFLKPIIDVAEKNAPISPCAGKIPTKEKGIAATITMGVMND
jgi:glutamine amidotransferase PdxT